MRSSSSTTMITALVDLDSGGVQPEVVGVRYPPDSQQQVGANDPRCALLAADVRRDAVAFLVYRQTFRLEADVDALLSPRCPVRLSDTSSSSRPISRGPISMTVTRLPKRRYIWPNSSPT